MLSEMEWEGSAGKQVWLCEIALARATQAVESARDTLIEAQKEMEAASRDFDTAKRVYFAGQVDSDRRIGSPQVTLQKRKWMLELSRYDVFGMGEMRDAADKAGWDTTEGNLRVHASNYRKFGYFVGLERGVMRLDQKRIVDSLGDIFQSISETVIPEGKNDVEQPPIEDDTPSAVLEISHPNTNLDFMDDDDPPF